MKKPPAPGPLRTVTGHFRYYGSLTVNGVRHHEEGIRLMLVCGHRVKLPYFSVIPQKFPCEECKKARLKR